MWYCTNTEWRTIVHGCENIVLLVLYVTCLFVYTYLVFVFFFGGETTKESKINDAESTLLVDAVEEDGVIGCVVDPVCGTLLIRRKVRDTDDVETEASIAIDAGTPANDPPKTTGAIVLKTETMSSRTDHNRHLSVFCSQRQGA